MSSRKSKRNKLRKFIESLPVLKNVLDIKVTDPNAMELTVHVDDNNTIQLFPHKEMECFIVKREGIIDNEPYIEIEDIKFTHRMHACLVEQIDAFIHNRSPKIRDVIRVFKEKRRGAKLRRIAERAKNKDKK
jgi:hypothetical protein